MNIQWFRISCPFSPLHLSIAEHASGQHFDIFLARPAAGTQTVVGGADVDALAYDDVTSACSRSRWATLAANSLALEPGVNHPDINNPAGRLSVVGRRTCNPATCCG